MIAFIGGGNMAEGLIKGMTQAGMRDIIVSEPVEARRMHLAASYGIKVTSDNKVAVAAAEIVVLAVKPQQMEQVLDELADPIGEQKTVVSIAAGITLDYYTKRLKTGKIVRVMPNMAATVQENMSVYSVCDCFTGPEINRVKEMLMASGRVLALPERMMDAVTAVSGSGPAFIALFADCMIKAGVSMGLPEDAARDLTLQTLIGTAKLLDTGLAPDKLISMVRSPGGTTAEGLKVFEAEGLALIVDKALKAAAARSRELAR